MQAQPPVPAASTRTPPPDPARPAPRLGRQIGIASAIWAGSIALSRALGLVREIVLGRTIGAGLDADVYFQAHTLPDFLNYLLAGGALSIVFLPIFSGYLTRGEEQKGWRAFSSVANFLLLGGGLAAVGLAAAARPLAPRLLPEVPPEALDRFAHLVHIMLPAQVFHLVGGLLSATLMARDRHLVPALAPLVYSACVIAGGLMAPEGYATEGFAWGVATGAFLGPFLLPLAAATRSGLRWRPILELRGPDFRHYLLASLPIMLGQSIVVVDAWIVRYEGARLVPGAIAWLQYARVLTLVPVGLLGMATAVASFPALTRHFARGQTEEAYGLVAAGLRRVIPLAICAQLALMVAGKEMVGLIWGVGSRRFSPEDVQATAQALTILSLGLTAWCAQLVVSRGFYAMGNTWLPVLVGTVLVPVCYPLYRALRMTHGVQGLALASALSLSLYAVALALLLRRIVRRRAPEARLPGVWGLLLRCVVIAAGVYLLGSWLRPVVDRWWPSDDLLSLVVRLVLLAGAACALYAGVLLALTRYKRSLARARGAGRS